ncbi:MAG: hypothetical protein RLZZ519_781 [Bacteroidota bacterium]
MKRRRTYLAWMLLLVAVTFAVPRTWIHDCSPLGDAHGLHHEEGDHDEVDHASCPICDFAPTPSIAPMKMAALLAPEVHRAMASPILDFHSYRFLPNADLRGPPFA